MFDVQPSGFRKHQNIAGIAGCIGFILGISVSGIGLLLHIWQCPFGNGFLQVLGFLILVGLVSAVVVGNLVALILIWIAKIRQNSRKLP